MVADVVGSTEAIAAGKYRAVNTVGVSVIAALRNVTDPVDIPYVFGGDGATLCLPERFAEAAHDALAATIAMARRGFGLELRAATVSIAYLRGRKLDVLVARHRISEHYVQCALWGGGVDFAEEALKSGELPDHMVVVEDGTAEADFSGLECRWEEIPSPSAETVAVIVESTDAQPALDTFRWVLERVREIYGDPEQCRPVVEKALEVSTAPGQLSHEALTRSWRDGPLRRFWALLKLRALVLIGVWLFRTGRKTESTDWGRYKADLVANTDFRKFDGTVRLVLSGSAEQRETLETFLEQLTRAGTIRYGVHVAKAAVMTCMVDEYENEHVHFVDASGGGYARAARSMKARRTAHPAGRPDRPRGGATGGRGGAAPGG